MAAASIPFRISRLLLSTACRAEAVAKINIPLNLGRVSVLAYGLLRDLLGLTAAVQAGLQPHQRPRVRRSAWLCSVALEGV